MFVLYNYIPKRQFSLYIFGSPCPLQIFNQVCYHIFKEIFKR